MKTFSKYGIFILLTSLFSCHEDKICCPDSYEYPDVITIISPIKKAVIGRVVDLNGNPLENAKVNLYNQISYTTSDGVFMFKNAQMDAYGSVLIVSKNGYFTATKKYTPTKGEFSQQDIVLIPRNVLTTIDPSVDHVVELNESAKINFKANCFISDDGKPYIGKVKVFGYYLSPENDKLDQIMPGQLVGMKEAHNPATRVNIASLGMIVCELEDESGNRINLDPSKPATLHFPLSENLRNDAPADIFLWYYDIKDDWQAEGVAIKNNNEYIAEVKHFTWWNCDIPLDKPITLKGKVLFEDGSPATNIYVNLTIEGIFGHIGGLTENDGSFATKIPINQIFNLDILYTCGTIYSDKIGPFSNDITLPDIIINKALNSLKGKVLDCNQQNVNSGYVILKSNTYSIVSPILSNGEYLINPICTQNSSFQVFAFDFITGLSSKPLTINIPPTNELNISICNNCLFDFNIQLDNIPSCNANDGALSVSPSGGSGQFTYLWSNGSTASSINQLMSGQYCITVTDNKDQCSLSKCIDLNSAEIKLINEQIIEPECKKANGTMHFEFTGGKAPYTVKLNGVAIISTNNIINVDLLIAGVYILEIADASGCQFIKTILLSENCPCNLKVNVEKIITCSEATIKLKVTGGADPYVYLWDNGKTGSEIKIDFFEQSKKVCFKVKDSKSCLIDSCITIQHAYLPVIMTSIDENCLSKSFQISPNIEGGSGVFDIIYTFNGENNNTGKFSVLDKMDQYLIVSIIDKLNPECPNPIQFEFPVCLYGNTDMQITPHATSCGTCADGYFDLQRINTIGCDKSPSNGNFEIYKVGDNTNLFNDNATKSLKKGNYEIYYVNGAGCYLYGITKKIE